MEILEKVTAFAGAAHGEQRRKYGDDLYIVHPVRVMKLLSEFTTDKKMLAAALLHDVLEDTPVTEEEIKSFLMPLMGEKNASETLKLVIELTDQYIKSAYPELNRKRRKSFENKRMEKISPQAQTIKYADVIDNCTEIVEHDRSFARLYLYECRQLLNVINKGDQRLYQLAVGVVNKGIQSLAS